VALNAPDFARLAARVPWFEIHEQEGFVARLAAALVGNRGRIGEMIKGAAKPASVRVGIRPLSK